ncbi:hypothetical protein [Zoogloea sp.]|uniref:TPR end-of-group domain-containing protein n=1 Tax=Zoogloea sp. TaxID=49181 RepID=UPI0035B1C09B
MTKQLSWLLRGLIPALLLAVLSACGRDDGTRILGHWRSERLQVQSVSLPMGPEFVVSAREVTSVDGDISIPISSIESEGNAVTLGLPLGIGLAFYFETNDRIYFDMPLAGRVYFYRVKDLPQQTRVIPAPQVITPTTAPLKIPPPPGTIENKPASAQMPAPLAAPVTTAPHGDSATELFRRVELKLAENTNSEAEALLAQARRQYGDNPKVDYYYAILRMRQGDEDSAVRSLRDAFEHGFRDFSLINDSLELRPLKSDPRFKALITRYQ